MRGYFLFGLSYGVASLSCTLPIFLAVVGSSFAATGIATSFAQFVLYALGMGVVIIALTLSMALFKGAMLSGMRKVMPYVHPIGTWLMIVRGDVHSVSTGSAWVACWARESGQLQGLSIIPFQCGFRAHFPSF